MNYFEVNGKRYSVDEMMSMSEAELFDLLNEFRSEGYHEGYNDGYHEGYDVGFDAGYDSVNC